MMYWSSFVTIRLSIAESRHCRTAHLPVQEEPARSRVWADSPRDYVPEVTWYTIGARENIRVE